MQRNQNDIEIARKMINLHQSASSRNLEFDLSFETVKKLIANTHCFYTGQEFEEGGKFAMSVDRLDPNRGYVEGNVVACTIDINAKKANLTILEIKQLCDKLEPYLSIQPVTPVKPKAIGKYSKYKKNAAKKNHQKGPDTTAQDSGQVQGV